jgi:hypothetical protein
MGSRPTTRTRDATIPDQTLDKGNPPMNRTASNSAISARPRGAASHTDAEGMDSGFLAPYFRDLSAVDVMTRDEELSAAILIATLRRSYWRAILAYPPFIDGICDLANELLPADEGRAATIAELKKASRNLRDRDLLVHQKAFETAREQVVDPRAGRGGRRRGRVGPRARGPRGGGERQHRGADDEAQAAAQGQPAVHVVRVVGAPAAPGAVDGQDGVREGEPAAGRDDRAALHARADVAAGPDPGGEHRADEGGRPLRPPPRVPLLDLRELVDPARDQPVDRRQGPGRAPAGPHDRRAQQGQPGPPRLRDDPRAPARPTRRSRR